MNRRGVSKPLPGSDRGVWGVPHAEPIFDALVSHVGPIAAYPFRSAEAWVVL
jgi:hypothetical protein